ncbi:MAG: DUF2004 domain-containing protein [Thermoplasmata archaeon]
MARGIEVAIHLTPGPTDTDVIAGRLGNLAAFRLGRHRGEALQWQVLRVVESDGKHFFRLIVRHPDRVLDIGIHRDLARLLEEISSDSPEQLEAAVRVAESEGLKRVPVRTIRYEVDYWRDDFWNWIG